MEENKQLEMIQKINERLDKMGEAFRDLTHKVAQDSTNKSQRIEQLKVEIDKQFLALHQRTELPIERRYFVSPHCSDATELIDTAHALSFSELRNVPRMAESKVVGTTTIKYAKLEHMTPYLNPILSKYELSVRQMITHNEYGQDILITRLSHKSGQWYESRIILRFDKSYNKSSEGQVSNQQVGGSITYMRRYALLAILGVGQTDDPEDTDK